MSSRQAPERPAPQRRPSLTGRAGVLALVLAALVFTLALPVREYLAQRATIEDLQAGNEAAQKRIDALAQRREQWDDPDFVKAQARERLHYVLPGETSFVVVGGTDPQATPTDEPAAPVSGDAWYSRLWATVEQAGQQP